MTGFEKGKKNQKEENDFLWQVLWIRGRWNLDFRCELKCLFKASGLQTCFCSSVCLNTINGLVRVFLGSKRNLHCVNDYLTTINCSLSGWDPDRNGSYTLNLTETTDEWESCRMYIAREEYWVLASNSSLVLSLCRTKYGCELQEIDRIYFCSIRIHKLTPGVPDTFDALDSYSITLCHSASQRCEELIDDYQVSENSKQPS